GRDAAALRNYNCRQSVQNIVPSSGGHREFSKKFSLVPDPKPHSFAINGKIARNPIIPLGEPVSFHGTEGLLRRAPQGWARILCVAPDHHVAAPWNQIDQAAECQLVGLKIWINVGVIVFERSNDQIIRMIMEKLGPA